MQVQAGEPRGVIGRTVEKIEGLLGATGANLMYMPAILMTRSPMRAPGDRHQLREGPCPTCQRHPSCLASWRIGLLPVVVLILAAAALIKYLIKG
jgi:hypothetical protein